MCPRTEKKFLPTLFGVCIEKERAVQPSHIGSGTSDYQFKEVATTGPCAPSCSRSSCAVWNRCLSVFRLMGRRMCGRKENSGYVVVNITEYRVKIDWHNPYSL